MFIAVLPPIPLLLSIYIYFRYKEKDNVRNEDKERAFLRFFFQEEEEDKNTQKWTH